MDSSFPGEWIPLVLFAVCFFHPLVSTKRCWKKNMGFGPGTDANIHCLQRCLIHRKRQWPSGMLYCSFGLSSISHGPQLRARPLVRADFLIFRGGGFDQNPACIFPEIQVFFKIICFFPLREVEIKWFSWALGETSGVFIKWILNH